MSRGRSEPAGLCGLRKQVTKAKEGPLEFRKKKGRETAPGGRRVGKARACSIERSSKLSPLSEEVLSVSQRQGF